MVNNELNNEDNDIEEVLEDNNENKEEDENIEEEDQESLESQFIDTLNNEEFNDIRTDFLEELTKTTNSTEIDKQLNEKIGKMRLKEGIDSKMLAFNSRISLQQSLQQQFNGNNIARYLFTLARMQGKNLADLSIEDIEEIFRTAKEEIPKNIARTTDRIIDTVLKQMEQELERKKEIESLRSENKRLHEILKKYANRIRQLEKDFQNTKTRHKKLEEDYRKNQIVKVFEELIPVYDHFKCALNEIKTIEEDSVIKGFKLIAQEFMQGLNKLGLEKIETVGSICDYNKHEIMMAVEDNEHLDNEILEEFKPGYIFEGKVIRPAGVKVAISKSRKENSPEIINSEDDEEIQIIEE
ncbi:MAG: nucleotide exchange factor GrpE [Candidatus Coatesbacteria bacterium]|nr:nucleotide exchange factor GrpE [Candidatus Coatesbacteria bacterium]